MPIICPQRDALEALENTTQKLPEGFKLNCASRLPDGTPLHLLGVSQGASARRNPNLHISVFGKNQPKSKVENIELLKKCGFAAILIGPEDGNLFTVEGLHFESINNGVAVFSLTGHRCPYRSV